MRRIAIAVTTAVVISLLSARPAAADNVVVSYSGLPDGIEIVQQTCGAEDVSPATYERNFNVEVDMLNDASLWVQVPPGSRGGVRIRGESLQKLDTFRVPLNYDTSLARLMHLVANVDVQIGASKWHLNALFLKYGPDWVSNDYSTADYDWTEVGGAGTGHGSLREFAATVGDGAFTAAVWADECLGNGGTSFATDAVAYGQTGSVVTYDFERPARETSMFLMSTGWDPSPAGRRELGVGLVALSRQWSNVTNAPVTLSIRHLDEAEFTVVAHAVTDEYGDAFVHVPLKYSSIVRWSFAGDDIYPPCSMSQRMDVSPRLGIRASARSLARTQRLTLSGMTVPAKPGVKVTLWREAEGHAVRLAHTFVHRDGSYAFHREIQRRGVSHLYTTVAKSPANSSGRSRTLDVTVR